MIVGSIGTGILGVRGARGASIGGTAPHGGIDTRFNPGPGAAFDGSLGGPTTGDSLFTTTSSGATGVPGWTSPGVGCCGALAVVAIILALRI